MKWKWTLSVLFISSAALIFLSCKKSENPSVSATSQPSSALDEVRLGYFANVTHAQAVLGVYSGDFQTALGATKLTPKVFNAGPELIQSLNSGAIDIAYVGPGPVIVAQGNSGGKALRIISGSAANGGVIVARADSGI